MIMDKLIAAIKSLPDHIENNLKYEPDVIALIREAFEGKTLVPDDDIEFLGQCFTIPNGCGDNSCLIKPTSGAGTNGGCRCDSNRALVNIVFARWQTARTRVKAMLAASAGEES